MALPMLINNGADCGPVNPLQNFAKRFDHDRGVQSDHFASSRAGPSRETFRSQPKALQPGLEHDVNQFFGHGRAIDSTLANDLRHSTFDLSALNISLPASSVGSPMIQSRRSQTPVQSSWAADFISSQSPAAPQTTSKQARASIAATNPHWTADAARLNTVRSSTHAAPMPEQNLRSTSAARELWEKEFDATEVSLSPRSHLDEVAHSSSKSHPLPQESDDLARTAGLLIETVKHEQNPKFQGSQFMTLMRQIRDREMIVEGNEMVPASQTATATTTDSRGKGRVVDFETVQGLTAATSSFVSTSARRKSVHFEEPESTETPLSQEDDIDAYFRQENADYQDYWNPLAQMKDVSRASQNAQQDLWYPLQEGWDSFEATSFGYGRTANYQFQRNNPYLSRHESATRHHKMHLESRSPWESVLEMEAIVQHGPRNSKAWFDLGVKQQENEREFEAILALQKAVELDSSYLPAWLALAVSLTNENRKDGAHSAISEWLANNHKYDNVVKQHLASSPSQGTPLASNKHQRLINCLMAMARSGSGEIDADVQIALAVLLNATEDYTKAQDCFKTALAARPDDWLLYNRVGATLANGGNAEGALEYYYRALELNPAYIRARYNLGISCINLRRYAEAAHHILDALVLQDSDNAGVQNTRGITSTALWDSLKTTCLHLQRIDLATLCDQKDIDGLRSEFNI